MSLDYPNRKDWLNVRSTPRKLPGRMVHVSAPLVTVPNGRGGFQTIVGPGTTLRIGSKARKRKEFAAKKAAKALRRSQRNFYPVALRKVA